MNKNIIIKLLDYDSDDYKKTVSLRYEILRKPLGLKFSDKQLEQEYSDFHFGCFINDKLVGCLILSSIDKNVIRMRQVAVEKKYQGKQIGTILVKYSEEFAKRKGYNKMVLHAREVAVKFYLKLEYEIVGEKFIEIGLTHFKMKKEL
ncbi:MAG: GNAT family N-acetyltransferase [Candidatus Marinimicrobia bacterium]|nr:GNAT family N-acetyltransferase [Candidatus Neomarinimicrobiota bacterium]